MSYATGEEFVQRYDVRLIGDLVKDDGVQASQTLIPTHPVVLALLGDASGAIDAALLVGNRYTPAQLADLSATAASFLRRLTSDLTLIYLKRRRGRFDPEKDGALLKEINATLDSLRKGEDLLLLADQTQAAASTIELVRPELIPVCRKQTIRHNTRNYYPLPRSGAGCGCE